MSRPTPPLERLLVRQWNRRTVHVVDPTRPLLPDGRLSFHDRPMCGIGASWHPVRSAVGFRFCRRCVAVLQRPRPALLAAIVESGRDGFDRAALLDLMNGWSDPATVGQVRGALIRLGLAGDKQLTRLYSAIELNLSLREPPRLFQRPNCRHKLCPSDGCRRAERNAA